MDKRVVFDFEITCTNGVGMQGQNFRLGIKTECISDQELEDYIIRNCSLL